MPTKKSSTATKPAKRKGLSPSTFKGLSKKRMASKAAGSGKRLAFTKEDPTVTVQFLTNPDQFLEYEIHSFQEDGRWHFVPCAGRDDCPLCDSDDEKQRRPGYRFAANVVNIKTGKVQILEGPKTLAGLIFYRYERKPALFKKRVFDVTKFPTQPVTYNFELAEEDAVSVAGKKGFDLDEYLTEEMKSYYGEDLDNVKSDLEADDDDDEDVDDDADDLDDEDDLDDADEDLDEDEDDDEGDDDEDEDDDDEDDEPPARKAAAKKSSKPVKKAAATKRR